MFVRLKKIKGQKYAYLVKNKWTKNGPRQNTKRYLGRTYELPVTSSPNFIQFVGMSAEELVKKKKLLEIVQLLFEFELQRHGFTKDGPKYIFDNISVSPKMFKILDINKKTDLVLKMNDGFACELLLSRIQNYKFKGEENEAKNFAELFISAGINIDKEVFVELFRKLSNQ